MDNRHSPYHRPRTCPPSPLLQHLVWGCILLAHCAPARSAGPDERRPIDVAPTAEAPAIDGRLDEPLWQRATPSDAFVARYPVEGATPSRRTEVLLTYTGRALYIGLRAFEPEPDGIRATALRRDDFAITGDDQFAIAIDTYRDRRNGYWFSTNPLGARVDAQFADEGARFEDNWNGVWAAAAVRCDGGWCAELEIPWATLRFPAGPEVEMGINLFRRVPATNEQLFTPLIPLSYDSGTPSVSLAQPYRFRGIGGGARLDLRPFALAAFGDRGPGASAASGGLFARYAVSDALALSGTLRADFSDVEVDAAQLHLSRFPLFLPEKREFFLENAGTFAFGAPGVLELFFSRAIGLVTDPAGGTRTVPLDWGIKATGRTGPVEFGLFSAATGSSPGVAGERFDVARAKVALGGRSYAGGFWSRRDGGAAAPHATFGADFSHYFARQVRLDGFVARDDQGDASADAWYLSLARGGERLAFGLSALESGAGFDPAIGLAERSGARRIAASLHLPWFPGPESALRRCDPSVELLRWTALDGAERDTTVAAGFRVDWKNDLHIGASLQHQHERLAAPFALYRDVVVPAGDYQRWNLVASAGSDPARPLSWEAEFAAGGLYGGEHRSGSVALNWRRNHLVTLGATLVADRIALDEARFTAAVAELRVGLTPSARLRLDLLGQYQGEQRAVRAGLRARYELREGTGLVVAWDAEELGAPAWRGAGLPAARSQRGVLRFNWLAQL